jgi:hypothetical protein
VKITLNLPKNTTTRCAQSPKPKCDNELSKSEEKNSVMGYNWTALLSAEPWGFSERRRISCPAGQISASQEEAFFMELIIPSNNKTLMAQNYRSIRNNIQCAVHRRSKRRKKNVMVCRPVFGRVRKGAKGDYKLRHVCPSA